jgi:hypothetical protein
MLFRLQHLAPVRALAHLCINVIGYDVTLITNFPATAERTVN